MGLNTLFVIVKHLRPRYTATAASSNSTSSDASAAQQPRQGRLSLRRVNLMSLLTDIVDSGARCRTHRWLPFRDHPYSS